MYGEGNLKLDNQLKHWGPLPGSLFELHRARRRHQHTLWSGASVAPRGWTDLPMGKLVAFNIYLTLRMDAHGISTYYSAQEANHKLSTYCTHVVPVSWKVGYTAENWST